MLLFRTYFAAGGGVSDTRRIPTVGRQDAGVTIAPPWAGTEAGAMSTRQAYLLVAPVSCRLVGWGSGACRSRCR